MSDEGNVIDIGPLGETTESGRRAGRRLVRRMKTTRGGGMRTSGNFALRAGFQGNHEEEEAFENDVQDLGEGGSQIEAPRSALGFVSNEPDGRRLGEGQGTGKTPWWFKVEGPKHLIGGAATALCLGWKQQRRCGEDFVKKHCGMICAAKPSAQRAAPQSSLENKPSEHKPSEHKPSKCMAQGGRLCALSDTQGQSAHTMYCATWNPALGNQCRSLVYPGFDRVKAKGFQDPLGLCGPKRKNKNGSWRNPEVLPIPKKAKVCVPNAILSRKATFTRFGVDTNGKPRDLSWMPWTVQNRIMSLTCAGECFDKTAATCKPGCNDGVRIPMFSRLSSHRILRGIVNMVAEGIGWINYFACSTVPPRGCKWHNARWYDPIPSQATQMLSPSDQLSTFVRKFKNAKRGLYETMECDTKGKNGKKVTEDCFLFRKNGFDPNRKARHFDPAAFKKSVRVLPRDECRKWGGQYTIEQCRDPCANQCDFNDKLFPESKCMACGWDKAGKELGESASVPFFRRRKRKGRPKASVNTGGTCRDNHECKSNICKGNMGGLKNGKCVAKRTGVARVAKKATSQVKGKIIGAVRTALAGIMANVAKKFIRQSLAPLKPFWKCKLTKKLLSFKTLTGKKDGILAAVKATAVMLYWDIQGCTCESGCDKCPAYNWAKGGTPIRTCCGRWIADGFVAQAMRDIVPNLTMQGSVLPLASISRKWWDSSFIMADTYQRVCNVVQGMIPNSHAMSETDEMVVRVALTEKALREQSPQFTRAEGYRGDLGQDEDTNWYVMRANRRFMMGYDTVLGGVKATQYNPKTDDQKDAKPACNTMKKGKKSKAEIPGKVPALLSCLEKHGFDKAKCNVARDEGIDTLTIGGQKHKMGSKLGEVCITRVRIRMDTCSTCCCKGGLVTASIDHELVYGTQIACGKLFSVVDAGARIATSVWRIGLLLGSFGHNCL